MLKFYCEVCKDDREVESISLKIDGLNPAPWGEIVCAECHFVIVTVSADKPGDYVIMRIADRQTVAG